MMKKSEKMLQDIYEENRSINRNLQRITSIGLIAVLGNILKDAKAKGDDKTVGIGKLALLALALAQFLLLLSDISAMMRKRNEEKMDEYEEK